MRTAVDRIRALLDLEADADVVLVPFPPPRTLSEEVAELLDARIARVLSDRLPLPAAARWMESWWLDLPLDSPILVPPMLVEIR
jgi:hypothetical protein